MWRFVAKNHRYGPLSIFIKNHYALASQLFGCNCIAVWILGHWKINSIKKAIFPTISLFCFVKSSTKFIGIRLGTDA